MGLENLLFAVGSDFLEIIYPMRDDVSAARYRVRRSGDTGYMIIFQTDDVERFERLAEKENGRIVYKARYPNYYDIHLHTKDTGGALLSMATQLPKNVEGGHWYSAGVAWERMERSGCVSAILAAELQSDDPQTLARRWGRLLGLDVIARGDAWVIAVDDGELRLVAATDGRGEGFSGFDVKVTDQARIEAAATNRGLKIKNGILSVCGMHCRLVD